MGIKSLVSFVFDLVLVGFPLVPCVTSRDRSLRSLSLITTLNFPKGSPNRFTPEPLLKVPLLVSDDRPRLGNDRPH